MVSNLQTRLRSRSSESPTPELPETLGLEPEQATTKLFQTRSNIQPVQQQIAAIQGTSDWPVNRTWSESPELRSYPAGKRSQTSETEIQPETAEIRPETHNRPAEATDTKSRSYHVAEHRPQTPERHIRRIESPENSDSPTNRFQKNAEQLEKLMRTVEHIQKPVPVKARIAVTEEAEVNYKPTQSSAKAEGLPIKSVPEEAPVAADEAPKDREQPDPSLSSDKKLEFFLVRGPPPQVEKSRAISQTQGDETPPTRTKTPPATPPPINGESRGQFNPVMSQLRRETSSRQAALEKHTSSSEKPYQVRGRESFLGLGSPARVKMKPTNLVIPQFKQNVVNGLTEIIVSLGTDLWLPF